jgi:putative DNA primase/helicase
VTDAFTTQAPSDLGPYARAAEVYRAAGWQGVLPVVGKNTPPGGFTGRQGAWPDDDQVRRWIAERGADNVGLRLPADVIGIDVDAHSGRPGLATLEWFEQTYGPLPATWTSTSRADGSRIALFRVPPGISWVSDLGRDSAVEIIRHSHRYAVVWPSVHPDTHGTYRWHTPDGVTVERPPHRDELSQLPAEWITALSRGTERPGAPPGLGGASEPSHEREDRDALDADGRAVDVDRILTEGIPPGEQQTELFRYMCSLRARGARRSEMIALGMIVLQNMPNQEGRDPWTREQIIEIVDRVRREYGPGTALWAGIGPGALAWAQRLAGAPGADHDPARTEVSELPPREPLATDLGNSLRVTRVLGDRLRWAADQERWYCWDGRRWAPDLTNRALDLTKEVIDSIRVDALGATDGDERQRWLNWARESEALTRRRAMLAGAQAEPDLVITADQLDRDPDLLVVRNGTLDLRTGQLRESRREDLCAHLAEVEYHPDAPAERWLGHVDFVTQGDPLLAAYLRRAVGYSLTGDVGARSFFFLEGSGSNGKNAFIEPIMMMLGSYARTTSTALLTGGDEQHPTIMADLLGARLVFVDETRQGKALNVERMKALTGSKRVKARRMRQDFFEFDAQFKLWIAGNGQPTVRDPSDGIWNRMHRVICRGKVDPGQRIDRFGDLLYAEEASGILSWALGGLLDWRQLGSLGVPDSVREDVQAYRDDEDYVGQFVEDCLVVTGDRHDVLPSDVIFGLYKTWAEQHGLRGIDLLNSKQLSRQLTPIPGLSQPKNSIRYMGRKCRVFLGVRIAD